jgi:hypothetical protein
MKITKIYVSACRRDWHLARLCLASIRYWYPRFPVCLIKDLGHGEFDTSAAEKKHAVEVLASTVSNFGYGFSKLEPLFLPGKQRYLMLDADLLVLGRVIEFLEQSEADFVVHPETNGREHTETLAYKLGPLAELDPGYLPPDRIFNSGNYVATTGLLQREDFEGLIRWDEPRSLVRPDVFMCGDQGVLNYVLFKAWRQNRLSVDFLHYYLWGGHGAPGVRVADLRTRKSKPQITHWAGPKSDDINLMPRSDLLRFYQEMDSKAPMVARLRNLLAAPFRRKS